MAHPQKLRDGMWSVLSQALQERSAGEFQAQPLMTPRLISVVGYSQELIDNLKAVEGYPTVGAILYHCHFYRQGYI
jgi:hypothetical protein